MDFRAEATLYNSIMVGMPLYSCQNQQDTQHKQGILYRPGCPGTLETCLPLNVGVKVYVSMPCPIDFFQVMINYMAAVRKGKTGLEDPNKIICLR